MVPPDFHTYYLDVVGEITDIDSHLSPVAMRARIKRIIDELDKKGVVMKDVEVDVDEVEHKGRFHAHATTHGLTEATTSSTVVHGIEEEISNANGSTLRHPHPTFRMAVEVHEIERVDLGDSRMYLTEAS